MTANAAALLLDATVKSGLVIGAAALVALAMWRRSAAERHLVWATAVLAVLSIPAASRLAPRLPVSVGTEWRALLAAAQSEGAATDASAGETPSRDTAAPDPGEDAGSGEAATVARRALQPAGTDPKAVSAHGRPSPLAELLVTAWLAGVVAALAPLGVALARLRRIARRSHPLDAPRWSALAARVAEFHGLARLRMALRRAEGPVTPLTWGILRPSVILPGRCEEWSDAQAWEVLVHEAGHVRRHDCLTQLLATVACVLYWWNPLVWLAARRMLVERERACDDLVLHAGARPSEYAGNLLELARSLGAPWSTAHVTTAMARRSQISGRLLAILDPDVQRGAVRRHAVAVSAVLAVVALVPLGGATLVATAESRHSARAPLESPAPEPPTPEPPTTSPSSGPQAQDLASARSLLRARERDFAAALERRDLDALAGFYTADARVTGPSVPMAVGRGSVRSLLQHLVDAGVERVEFEADEVYSVGDLLCETGTARLTRASGMPVVETRHITLWKYEDGTWRIHRDWAAQ